MVAIKVLLGAVFVTVIGVVAALVDWTVLGTTFPNLSIPEIVVHYGMWWIFGIALGVWFMWHYYD